MGMNPHAYGGRIRRDLPLPRWQQYGFHVRLIGLPAMVEGEACIAASIRIGEESLKSVRNLGGLRGSCLVREGLNSPVLERVPYAAA